MNDSTMESKHDQAVRDRMNSRKLLNGAGRYSAVMAAERREAEENRVPPLTDFTAENRDLPLDHLRRAVEAVAPMLKDGEEHPGKKP